jgi:DNA-3-methyladenine glycosylase
MERIMNCSQKQSKMSDPIVPEFYVSNDVVNLAKQLLGKVISTYVDGRMTSGIIVETEAYRGPDDRGSHAFGGRYTERTKTMFTTGGCAYVYICYGMHPMINVVTGVLGEPHVVLIRAIEPLDGIDIMMERRCQTQFGPVLTNGPAKLAVALGITKNMDGTLLYQMDSIIHIKEGLKYENADHIISGLRVGMSVHVGSCSYRPWRFYIKGNRWVSKPLVVKYNF